MSRRYNGYGGICRSFTGLDSSKQFKLHATMTLPAALTPWYRPPPFIDDIRWWDDFFLKFPCPSTPKKLDVERITLLRLKPMVLNILH
jgi:hypothetical protein